MHFTIIDDVYDINQIISITKAKHKRGEIDGVIIDYIQLCSGAKGENQNIKIGYISRSLKMLAQQLKIPVVGLSQFSRGSDKEDRQPELTDLRDSGSLEQDANCVMFLHTKKEERLKDVCPVSLIVAKNRGGRVGIIKDLVFRKSESQITDLEHDTNFDKMSYIHD
jgi:replicative DNA helicase